MEESDELGTESVNWGMQKNCYCFGYVGWIFKGKDQVFKQVNQVFKELTLSDV